MSFLRRESRVRAIVAVAPCVHSGANALDIDGQYTDARDRARECDATALRRHADVRDAFKATSPNLENHLETNKVVQNSICPFPAKASRKRTLLRSVHLRALA